MWNYAANFRIMASHRHLLTIVFSINVLLVLFTILLVYVDDVLNVGHCEKGIMCVKEYLHESLSIKDIGCAHYFLGLKIVRGENGTHVNQRKYTQDILADTGLMGR